MYFDLDWSGYIFDDRQILENTPVFDMGITLKHFGVYGANHVCNQTGV